MSPKVKFSKEDIRKVALTIALADGLKAITARKVADVLGCSVAPIYVNYASIDNLIADVVEYIFAQSNQLTKEAKGSHVFEQMGYASLFFAKQYPQLFRDLVLEPNNYIASYNQVEEDLVALMRKDETTSLLDDDQRRRLLFQMRTFQLGLSTMMANQMMPSWLSDEEAEEMMIDVGNQLLAMIQKESI